MLPPCASKDQQSGQQQPCGAWLRHGTGQVEQHQATFGGTAAVTDDLFEVVVGIGILELPAKRRVDQLVQVDQCAVQADERNQDAIERAGGADQRAMLVEVKDVHFDGPKAADVLHAAAFIQKSMLQSIRSLADPGHLSCIVDGRCAVDWPACQRAQVLQLAVAVQVRMAGRLAGGDRRCASNHAVIVDVRRAALGAGAQVAKCDELAIAVEKPGRSIGRLDAADDIAARIDA